MLVSDSVSDTARRAVMISGPYQHMPDGSVGTREHGKRAASAKWDELSTRGVNRMSGRESERIARNGKTSSWYHARAGASHPTSRIRAIVVKDSQPDGHEAGRLLRALWPGTERACPQGWLGKNCVRLS